MQEYEQLKLDIVKAEDRQTQIMQMLAEQVGRDAIIGGKKFYMQSRAGAVSWKKAFDALREQTGAEVDTEQFKGKESKTWKLV